MDSLDSLQNQLTENLGIGFLIHIQIGRKIQSRNTYIQYMWTPVRVLSDKLQCHFFHRQSYLITYITFLIPCTLLVFMDDTFDGCFICSYGY